MAADVSRDQLALIRINGMHCHKCEHAIRKALARFPGVHEVEVDFPSGQASVLHDRDQVSVRDLTDAINEVGYQVAGLTQQDVTQSTPQGQSTPSAEV
jgi:copper chaperone CopZ